MDRSLFSLIYGEVQESGPGSVAPELEAMLGEQPETPFRAARGSGFTNPVGEVHAWLDHMSQALAEQTDLKFIYVEMNGFDINYDRWFCAAFGYSKLLDPDAEYPYGFMDELAGMDASLHWREDLTLTGMEDMQEAFRWRQETAEARPDPAEAAEVARLLVECRFLNLIKAGREYGPLTVDVPVAAGAHESDLVLRFDPPGAVLERADPASTRAPELPEGEWVFIIPPDLVGAKGCGMVFPADDEKATAAEQLDSVSGPFRRTTRIEAWNEIEFRLDEAGDFCDLQLTVGIQALFSERLREVIDGGLRSDDELQWLPVGLARPDGSERRPYFIAHIPNPPEILALERCLFSDTTPSATLVIASYDPDRAGPDRSVHPVPAEAFGDVTSPEGALIIRRELAQEMFDAGLQVRFRGVRTEIPIGPSANLGPPPGWKRRFSASPPLLTSQAIPREADP